MANPLDDLPTVVQQYPNGTGPERERALAADNARLRALIKAQESGGNASISYLKVCPWCRAYIGNNFPAEERHPIHTQRGTNDEPHGRGKDDCPAFTPKGEVR